MTTPPASHPDSGLQHRLRRMTGRDTGEQHRASTPLELLFDLTFVVGFGQAASLTAGLLAMGHVLPALGAFAFAMFAVCWAWVNFSWFASAFDTDDWFFRVSTMVQMVGVLILALGLPAFFSSLDAGHGVDNNVMVAGYVVMRIAMVAQWLRAAYQDPTKRRIALNYAAIIFVAQVGWVTLLFVQSIFVLVPVFVLVIAIDALGPIFAEKKDGGTPWHAHHIAERYGLLTIIALGEGVVGTIASVSAAIEHVGWSSETVFLVVAGTGLTFSLWWFYFIVPSGRVLELHRDRGLTWGYFHIPLFMSITLVGAGLEVAAEVIDGRAEVGELAAVLIVASAVLLFVLVTFVIYAYLVHALDWFHLMLIGVVLVLLGLAISLAYAGVSMGVCLLIVTLAPISVVVGYETIGYRHEARVLAQLI